MTVAISRIELEAADLRAAAGRCKDAAAARRMLAICPADGRPQPRRRGRRRRGMDRQMLRDWVHRYNERGLAGLHNTAERGRPPRKLTAEQEAVVAEWVHQGPPPERKIVRWHCIDLRDEIAREFGGDCTNARSASC